MALNDEAAERVRLAVEDARERNLVTAALNEARRLLVEAETDATRTQAPPCSPFDMEFFATIMAEYFWLLPMVERIVAGQSAAQASGWDD